MSEANDFIIAHGTRLLGIAETVFLAALLVWKSGRDYSVRKALFSAAICFSVALGTEFLTLPRAAHPVSLIGILTFKFIRVMSVLVAAGYALMVFAMYRYFGDLLRRIRGEGDPKAPCRDS
jgi:hypothetical protein